MALTECPECAGSVSSLAAKCPHCGAPVIASSPLMGTPSQDHEPPQLPVQTEQSAAPTRFCHACGKVIDARAEICPDCGVRQSVVHQRPASRDTSHRSVPKLIGLSILWSAVFHFLGAVAIGVFVADAAGATDYASGHAAGAAFGKKWGWLELLASLCLGIVLTVEGKLPGTKRRAGDRGGAAE